MVDYLTVCIAPDRKREEYVSRSLIAARKKGIAYIGKDRKAEAEIFVGRAIEYGERNLRERIHYVETIYHMKGKFFTDRDYVTQRIKGGKWQGFEIVMPYGMIKRE